jgi:riboflavin synthase
MFTGIVEEIGTVKSAQPGKLTIAAKKALEGTRLGDSIAVNGACLTVTALDMEAFSIDVMPETQRRTNLGLLHPRDGVNLERGLAVGGRMGGHFVQGHVDATGRVISLVPEEGAVLMRVAAPADIMGYVVEKGFIAVDGVSLTIVSRDATSFTVSLVAYTRENTILGRKKPGDVVNIEVDILAKYVEQLIKGRKSRITPEFLAEHGFLASQ